MRSARIPARCMDAPYAPIRHGFVTEVRQECNICPGGLRGVVRGAILAP